MANTKKYVSLDKLSLYDEKIKKVINDGDAASLQSAKDYADGLAVNYDAAGTAVTEAGKVQANLDKEVLRAQGEETRIAGLVATAQKDVDDLELVVEDKADKIALEGLRTYVGTIPTGEDGQAVAESVVKYIDKKTEGIASDAALSELQGKVDVIEGNYLKAADKTELEGKITDAQDAADAAQLAVDQLSGRHDTEKAALEGAIALKADITALNAVSDVANAAVKQADYDVKVAALEGEDARIAGLVSAEAERAAGVESGLRTDVDAIKNDYLKGADKTELSNAITAEAERAAGVEAGLQTQINTIMNNPDTEGVINSINEFTQYIADHGEIAEGFRTDIDANAKAIEDLSKEVVATYETKEDATAKFDEVKELVNAKAVQADWNQNDATAADYVKNRTHYDAESIVPFVENITFNTDGYLVPLGGEESCVMQQIKDTPKLELGKQYKVIFDGVEYICDAFTDQNFPERICIGNPSFVDVVEDNGMPFVVINGNGASPSSPRISMAFPLPEDPDAPLPVYSIYAIESSVKQLDEKFIPDTIARVSAVAALEGRMDTAEGAIEAVEGRLDVVEPKVDALEGQMAEVQSAVATKVEQEAYNEKIAALEGEDTAIKERLDAVEALMGDGEGSVADQIADVKSELQGEIATALADAKTDAANKDAVVLAEAQKGITAAQLAIDTHTANADIHVTAEQKTAWATAAGKAHEHGNLSVLEGITAEKVTAWDKVTSKADQTALQSEIDRATAKENELATAIASFIEVSEEEINNLFV